MDDYLDLYRCIGCKEELPRSKFSSIVNGLHTGKRLMECSDKTRDLVQRRNNVQLYCRSCQLEYRKRNLPKWETYYKNTRENKIK